MRRLILVLPFVVAAACASGGPTLPSGSAASTASGSSTQTLVLPTSGPKSDSTVVPADISTWFELAPVGMRFAVAMPERPATTSGRMGQPPAATTFWTHTDPNGRTFQVARSRLAALPASPTPERKSIEPSPSETPSPVNEFATTILESLQGGLLTEWTPVTVDGRPGARYLARSGNLLSSGLLVLNERTLYRLSVTYRSDRPDDPAVAGFLGSFTLMP